MANSVENPEDFLKISETLFIDSYYSLSRNKKNPKETANSFRELIRQIDMNCFIQNISKNGSDKLKSRFISEYYSLVDSQNQEGLLPIVSDDSNSNWFRSLPKNNFQKELPKVRSCLMDIINKSMKSYEEKINCKNSAEVPFTSIDRVKSSSSSEQLDSQSKNEKFYLERRNFSSFSNSKSNHRPEPFSVSSRKDLECASNMSIGKSNFQRKFPNQSANEITQKKRMIDSNDYYSRSSKRQINKTNYKQNTEAVAQNDSLKKSFIPASSMYKNPLKNACNSKENREMLNSSEQEGDKKNHPLLKNFDPKIVGIIMSEIMDFSPDVKWSDIAGLEFVKSTVQEIVIWPLLRPDIFTGLRAPPRGILLFGPPGTGKTLIGKCIATESNSTFFCISASSLASKWVGESEQLVRALFAVAQLNQPAVIFIDEIDSLLSQRSDQEQDHTRKLKTEFLVQFDGAKTNEERRVLVVGATNRPHELDEAARRRFVKRLYVPLPEESARLQIIEKLLRAHQHNLSNSDFKKICDETKGYSGSDVAHLCKEAAMGPIRSIGPEQIKTVSLDQVRPIELVDFLDALKQVRASVAQEDLNYYLDWNKKFGSFAI